MAYRVPAFNVFANLWLGDSGVSPAEGPPDYTDFLVQKYIAPRSSWPVTPPWTPGFWLAYPPPVQLRVPRVAPFDGPWNTWNVTCTEVPAGSGQYYRTFWADVQHEGFSNEYGLIVAVQCDADLNAIPPAGSSLPIGIGADPGGDVPPHDPPFDTIPPGPPVPPLEPPGPLLDNFSDTPGTLIGAHIADTGETWTQLSTDIVVAGSGGGISMTSTVGFSYALCNYAGPIDGSAHLTMTTPATSTFPAGGGLIYRADSLGSWLGAMFLPTGAPGLVALYLVKCVGGTITSVAGPSATWAYAASTAYDVHVTLTGSTCVAEVLIGGSPVGTLTAADTQNLDAHKVGVLFFHDAGHNTVVMSKLTKE